MSLFTAEGILRHHVRFGLRGASSLPGAVSRAYQRWLLTQGRHAHSKGVETDGWLFTHKELFAARAPGTTCVSALQQWKPQDGRCITLAIAQRDTLVARHRFSKSLLDLVLKRNKREGWDSDKARKTSILSVRELRAAQDRIGKQMRELDTSLQKVNWEVDLLD